MGVQGMAKLKPTNVAHRDGESRPSASSTLHTSKAKDTSSESSGSGESDSSGMSSASSDFGDATMSVTEEGSLLDATESDVSCDEEEQAVPDFWTAFGKGQFIMDPAQAFHILNGSSGSSSQNTQC